MWCVGQRSKRGVVRAPSRASPPHVGLTITGGGFETGEPPEERASQQNVSQGARVYQYCTPGRVAWKLERFFQQEVLQPEFQRKGC